MTTMRMHKPHAVFTFILAGSAFTAGGAHAATCPAFGADSDCGTIITINKDGTTIVSTGQGPYDDVEDTLVGVVNNSALPISSLGLKSLATIFGFDGDGIDSYGAPGNPKDGTGYGGPNAYFTNVTSAGTAGTVNFVTPLAPGKTTYFSLEEAISAAISCTDVVNHTALNAPPTGSQKGPNIAASFTPNNGLSLQQAAGFCGFVNFDWVQTKTHTTTPSAVYARNLNGAFDPKVVGPVNLDGSRAPYSDPPQGGGFTYTAQPDFSYPFYYDAKNGELTSNETGGLMLTYHDRPVNPCLIGGGGAGTPTCNNKTAPVGSYGAWTTHLAGVNADGTATDLGIGFSWKSDFNGATGDVMVDKSSVTAGAGNGTGGVTVLSVQLDTTYQYNGLSVSTINGSPATPPTVTSVSATPQVLWPPNNRLAPISIVVMASDGTTTPPVCSITGVASNEPLASGSQWAITGPLSLNLLAARLGSGTGRVYTITVSCTNASPFASSTTVTVAVPHDQSQ